MQQSLGQTPSTPQPGIMSNSQIKKFILENAKYKQRSHETHFKTHVPAITQLTKSIPKPPPTTISQPTTSAPPTTSTPNPIPSPPLPTPPPFIVLLGCSMTERFKTTRYHPSRIPTLPHTINLGVGGDKIENVLYRFQLGLLQLLKPLSPKLWVVTIGTNNLRPGQGPLRKWELENYALLLKAVFRVSPVEAKVIVVGIFKRKDVGDEQVEGSNRGIRGVVEKMNGEVGEGRMVFLEQPEELEKRHLCDHVHLGAEGYKIWDRVLFEKMMEVLGGNVSG